jgi:hypothetical protein
MKILVQHSFKGSPRANKGVTKLKYILIKMNLAEVAQELQNHPEVDMKIFFAALLSYKSVCRN